MRKLNLMILLFACMNTANAIDIYICDGFKVNPETNKLEQISDTKFEITRMSLGIEIKNQKTDKRWKAFNEIKEGFFSKMEI